MRAKKTECSGKKSAGPAASAKTTNVDPTPLPNREPNESIHDLDLNLMSLTVGIYKLSRTGCANA